MSCQLTAPGQSLLEVAQLDQPLRFGSQRNDRDGLSVDQPTLIALLGRLLVTGHAFRAFNLDPTGVVTVIDVDDRVRRLTPDEQLNHDLVSLDHACDRVATASRYPSNDFARSQPSAIAGVVECHAT